MKAKRQAVKARTAAQAKKAEDQKNAIIADLYGQIRQLRTELNDANTFAGIFVRLLERYMTREEISAEAEKMMEQMLALNAKKEDEKQIDPDDAAGTEPAAAPDQAEPAEAADSDGGDQ